MGSDSVNTIGPQLQVIKVFLTERRKEPHTLTLIISQGLFTNLNDP